MLIIGKAPQTSEWNNSKIPLQIDSLLLKCKIGYFPNWHEVQSKLSLDTKPNRPLEVNCCTCEKGAWPRWECQSAREGKEETTTNAVATEIREIGGRWRLFIRNIRLTLGLVLSVGKSGFVSHIKHTAEATNMDLFYSWLITCTM